jgi:hypothetical protein
MRQMQSGSKAAAVAEIAIMAAIFAAVGAWPVPDINEAVYLTKARHHADPGWAAGDFFLETPDAHGVFYVLFGPLAAGMPLEQAAWIGRGLGWIALAIGFRHAIAALLATPWGRVVAAAMFAAALRHTTMAGEWVIGGCEAKVFAWALVLAAVGETAAGRLAIGWLLAGAATAVHPIVGGWAMVAIAATWISSGGGISSGGAAARPRNAVAIGGLVAGAALAACGVLPALGLSAGASVAERVAANRIYVVDRLSHHLLPGSFAEPLVARHLLAILAWWLLSRLAGLPRSAAWSRVESFTLAAIAISLVGAAIACCESVAPDAAIGLLRFYWFRLADVMVPFSLAVSAAALLEDEATCRRLGLLPPFAWRAVITILLCADMAGQSRHWPWPHADGVVPRADAKVDAAAWADICDWVNRNTPVDACFLTPRGAASFTWRTGRRDVVAWKNSPQDARSLVEWRRRIADCFSADGGLANMETSTVALGAERLREVADRYGADYVIAPLKTLEACRPGCVPMTTDLPAERVHANAGYAVLRLEKHPGEKSP